MNMDLRKVIKNRNTREKMMYGLSFLPDSIYVSLFYLATMGKLPNLLCPQGFNEKLQWLKLHNRKKEYRDLVDKLKVRKYIKDKLGKEYLFPLLGYWKTFDDIDFEKLPDEFVLKCNHDSGSVKIINDKTSLSEKDMRDLKAFFDSRMSHDFFYAGREYPYKGINRYIFAERLMKSKDNNEGGINDYKFFCFDGIPKLMLYVSGRQTEKHEDYFDMSYKWLDIYTLCTPSPECPKKPESFEKMKKLAAELSAGIKHVRVDFYEIDGQVYFGEFTFFSGGGFERFHPDIWEQRLGEWIDLEKHK